ncbi:MAG: hypothetical protein AAFO69_06115 [Bacteroidota bacterium]
MKFKHQTLIKGNNIPLSDNTQKAITLFGKKYNLYRRLSKGAEKQKTEDELKSSDEQLYQQILQEISEQFDQYEKVLNKASQRSAKDDPEQILAGLFKEKGSRHIFSKKELEAAGLNLDFNTSRIIVGNYQLVQPTLSFVKEYRIFQRTKAAA